MNTKQAKNFLVEQAVEQAALEGVPLADVEKRMMYFTESDPASCSNPIELNDEFEAQYETKEYETKVSRLLHHASTRLKEEPERARNWDQAVRALRKGDHYLLVMVDQSSESDIAWWMPILWGIGISILLIILIIAVDTLEQKGFVPGWVFGWISNYRKFSPLLYGLLGIWVVVKLVKLGVLGEITKTIFNSILSNFASLRPKSRSRR